MTTGVVIALCLFDLPIDPNTLTQVEMPFCPLLLAGWFLNRLLSVYWPEHWSAIDCLIVSMLTVGGSPARRSMIGCSISQRGSRSVSAGFFLCNHARGTPVVTVYLCQQCMNMNWLQSGLVAISPIWAISLSLSHKYWAHVTTPPILKSLYRSTQIL